MDITKKNQLLNRIDNNYICFKNSLYGISREKLIKTAGRIAAVNETYKILMKYNDWDAENEIDFYLLFRDPLTIIADAWEKRKNAKMEDFDLAFYDVTFNDKIMSEYTLVDGADMKISEK